MFDVINPRQTVLVSCRGEARIIGKKTLKDNLIALDWHTPVSYEPFHYAISIGKNKFSRKLIDESKIFAVNFVSYRHQKEVLFCGRNSGEHIDKFEKTGLKKIEAQTIDCPRIRDSVAYLECRVVNQFELGDYVTFIGKVMNSKHVMHDRRLFHTEGDRFISF